jgi:hypothetical protein
MIPLDGRTLARRAIGKREAALQAQARSIRDAVLAQYLAGYRVTYRAALAILALGASLDAFRADLFATFPDGAETPGYQCALDAIADAGAGRPPVAEAKLTWLPTVFHHIT